MAPSCTIFDIFDIKIFCYLEISVRDQSRSLKLVPFDSLPVVSYQRPIVTLSLKCTIFDIADFDKY